VKHVDEFVRFLAEEVNLNKTRIDPLRQRVDVIQSFLKGANWSAKVVRFSPQGSWSHKTIIKPPGDQGFDADILVFVEPVKDWSPADYVLGLRDIFKSSGSYKDRVRLHTRCVLLEYSGDFTVDVVPCVVNRPGGSHIYEVCNRAENAFECTDGEAYTDWLAQRNAWVGTDKLREVTRLLKYLRDIKTTFTCKSILLTTLLGGRVTASDTSLQQTMFADLPSALKTLVDRLNGYLHARPNLHDINNPVVPGESFNRHWDQDKYANFRDMIHKYRDWIDEAFDEPDQSASITKWQRIFGDEWGRNLKADRVVEEASVASTSLAKSAGFSDLVQAVRAYGTSVLSNLPLALPWVKSPPWQMANNTGTVIVRATAHDREGGPSVGELPSGTVIPKGRGIYFQAMSPTGMPYSPSEYDVKWQVVNTDREAANANALRGGFYGSKPAGRRWERTLYRGVHWVQAFVVLKRSGRCIGRSDRFFVVIE
jgi:Second Messenger Oligonucleotide or Dinucleotide Synthetase domain/Adenylyl/Guanylyl and SMODS C-terminal sensor domain